MTDPRTGGTLTLRRTWPREPGCIHLELRDAAGAVVAGQWFADAELLATRAAATPAPARVVPGTAVMIQPDGADRRLEILRRLLAEPEVDLVAHRPERRAVLRRTTPEGTTSYVKVVRPGRTEAMVAAAALLSGIGSSTFRVPELLRHDADRGVVEWAGMPGRTLEQLGADSSVSDVELAAAWRATGRAVAAWHAAPVPAGVRGHDSADEVVATRRWVDPAVAAALLPPVDVGGALRELVTGPPQPCRLVHRDLHDEQVLVDPGGGPPGVIDADTASAGEPAVDLANVLVHIELRAAQGLLTPGRAALARIEFLTALQPDAATSARVPAYARATRLRLAGLYAFRPLWRDVVPALLAAAAPPG